MTPLAGSVTGLVVVLALQFMTGELSLHRGNRPIKRAASTLSHPVTSCHTLSRPVTSYRDLAYLTSCPAAGLFFYIPQGALGAIIISSVAAMVDYQVSQCPNRHREAGFRTFTLLKASASKMQSSAVSCTMQLRPLLSRLLSPETCPTCRLPGSLGYVAREQAGLRALPPELLALPPD